MCLLILRALRGIKEKKRKETGIVSLDLTRNSLSSRQQDSYAIYR